MARFWTINKTWTTKKIVLVSILISTSVSFIIVIADLFPFTALPSFKLTMGGLPIKLTGFIFGPWVGATTGVAADLISFMFRPTFLSPWYTTSFLLTGFLPGVVSNLYNKHWLDKEKVTLIHSEEYDIFNFVLTIVLIIITLISFSIFIGVKGDVIENSKNSIISNKWVVLGFSVLGLVSMLLAMLFFWFFLKPEVFNIIIPIIAFSTLLEIYIVPLNAIGDVYAFTNNRGLNLNNIFQSFLFHQIITPTKIWFNLFIIYYAFKIVNPLISNKESNGWK